MPAKRLPKLTRDEWFTLYRALTIVSEDGSIYGGHEDSSESTKEQTAHIERIHAKIDLMLKALLESSVKRLT